jgi:hypothetical protein
MNHKDVVKSLVRSLPKPITGHTALAVARLCHLAGIDGPGQWGNAYFRCGDCGEARDCDGSERWNAWWDLPECECEHTLTVEELVISEGWANRV